MANPITAPLRAAMRIVSAGPQLATRAFDVPLRVSAAVLRELLGKRRAEEPPVEPAERPVPQRPAPIVAEPVPPRESPPQVGADHVEVEAAAVISSADPDAAEGAGPELEILPPWDGYDQMSAEQLAERVAAADAAELAVVRLYESANRNRRSIDTAIDARLAELERSQAARPG